MILQFLTFTFLISQIEAQTELCYAEGDSPNLYFSSRTSYFASRGSEMSIPEHCQPIYLWGLFRHGTRYPDIDFIKSINKLYVLRDEIIHNHKTGRGNLCEKDLQNLAKWSSNVTADSVEELDLTPQGVKDEIFLAQEIKKKFPQLVPKSSTKNNYMFQTSGYSRTKKSAIVFANELLGTNFNQTEGNNITEDRAFLQPTDQCLKFAKSEENPSTDVEANLFKKTARFQKIIAEISIRLGFLQPLSLESIQLMQDMCAYENAWNLGSRPPLCAAFLPSEVEALNYLKDVQKYYKIGYANPLVHQVTCPIVRNLITSLTYADHNKGTVTEKGKFLFSHSDTIVSVTARLGLSKDEEPLRHDNYQKMINRKWKSSMFDSFAANIIAVLYKCSSQNGTQTKVVIYQNERQAVFKECNNSSLCSLETLQKMYSDVLEGNQCDMTFCQLNDSQKVSSGCSTISKWNSSNFVVIFFTSAFLYRFYI